MEDKPGNASRGNFPDCPALRGFSASVPCAALERRDRASPKAQAFDRQELNACRRSGSVHSAKKEEHLAANRGVWLEGQSREPLPKGFRWFPSGETPKLHLQLLK